MKDFHLFDRKTDQSCTQTTITFEYCENHLFANLQKPQKHHVLNTGSRRITRLYLFRVSLLYSVASI